MLLEPITIKNTKFKNRVVLPPMCMYSVEKEDGMPTDFHLAHYLTRAIGGVGYIIIESTAINQSGRITSKDLGIWDDKMIPEYQRLVNNLHKYGAKVGIQINHAGRKSKVGPLVAPSSLAFGEYPIPKELNQIEIDQIITEYGLAARRANEAGFDCLEIHGAHGYLINEFTSNLTNQRTDQYKDKGLFLRQVIKEVRKYWPEHKVLQLRISAYEYHKDGLTPEIWSNILLEYKDVIDLINVSSGGNVAFKVAETPGFQLNYAKVIKERTGIKTIAGGHIFSIEYAAKAIFDANSDFIYLGRSLLNHPFILLNETSIEWPFQYIRAKNS